MKKMILSLALFGALLVAAAPAKADSYAYVPGVLVVDTHRAPYTPPKYKHVKYKKHDKHRHDNCRDDRRVEYRHDQHAYSPRYYQTGNGIVWYR